MKLSIVVLTAIFVMALGVNAGTITLSSPDVNQSAVSVDIGDIEIRQGEAGAAEFDYPQADWLSRPTEPQIPWQIVTVLLPPDADIATAACEVLGTEYQAVEGIWDVGPAPAQGTWDEDGNAVIVWPDDKTIVDGRDADIYQTDVFWPGEAARVESTGKIRGWQLVEVAVPLVTYNPVTGELFKLIAADIKVDYSVPTVRAASVLNTDEIGRSRAEKIAVNFASVAADYEADRYVTTSEDEPAPAAPDPGADGYTIITTNSINNGLTKLDDFVAHKQSLGFDVKVVTETQWGGGTGDTAANNLRAWLQANYSNDNTMYVLLIGNPHPSSGNVPMKMCISDHPTDYFYAELDANWDADGDGIFGESGEAEKYFEVYVGRIPYYGSLTDTDAILQKTIDYENATDIDWRRRALLTMVPLDDVTSCYPLGEQIKNNYLEPAAIPSDRLYRDGAGFVASEAGYIPPPEFESSNYPATVWSQGQYGIIVWSTHGWTQGASGIISTGDVGNLNDNYPTATWQGSCQNSWPEETNNLAFAILKNGGIATCGATRNSWYWVGQTDFTNTNSIAGMGYQYARRLKNGKSCGQAMWDMKEALSFWDMNYYVFNVYGDPAVKIIGPAPDFTVAATDAFYKSVVVGTDIAGTGRTYTLMNNSSSSLNWTTSNSADWITLSTSSGTISAGGSASVNINFTAVAQDLGIGDYETVVTFTDTTNGISCDRKVILKVQPRLLTGYWKLDETFGTTAYDSSSNGNNGEPLGFTSFATNSTAGKYQGAVELDGVDDNIRIDPMNLNTNTMTMSGWIKRNGDQVDWAGIIFSRSGTTLSGLDVRANGELRYHWNGDSSSYNWASNLILPDGVWAFAALVVEPDKATMYMYTGGTMLSAVNNVSHDVEAFDGSIRIGLDNSGSRYFKGCIDEVRIYNYSLKPSMVAALAAGAESQNPQPADTSRGMSTEAVLSWVPGLNVVKHDVYFGTDVDAVSTATTESAEYMGRKSQNLFNPESMEVDTEYFWRVDEVPACGSVLEGSVWSYTTGGCVSRQVWFNISGNYVTDLTDSPNYPHYPDLEDFLYSFETPLDWADNYGSRVRGYLIPKTSGNYTFWIAGDDYCELWLSTNDITSNQVLIASVPGYTSLHVWDKYSQQQSASISLTAGQEYFIRAMHKEGTGGDHLAVAWQGPDSPTLSIIDGEFLMPFNYNETPAFDGELLDGGEIIEGASYSDSISGNASDPDGRELVFSKVTGPDWLEVAQDGQLYGTADNEDAGQNFFVVRAEDTKGEYVETILSINVVDLYDGQMGMTDLVGFVEHWLSDSCVSGSDCQSADLDGSGEVNISDMANVSENWSTGLQPGLEGWWCMNSGDSDTIRDNYGQKDGVLVNTTQMALMPGIKGDCLKLDGIDDYVEITGYKGVTGTLARTCSAWINTSVTSGEICIVCWGSKAAGQAWRLTVSNSVAAMRVYDGYIIGTANIADGQWHHVAVVLDADSPLSNARLYVDGVEDTISETLDIAINTASTSDVIIGSNFGASWFFEGYIDEVRIYNRPLSRSEILVMAQRDGLEGWWHFDEDTGLIAYDSSGHEERHGNLVNMTTGNWVTGQSGNCLSFDGIDDYVDVNGYKGITGSSARTCSAWIKTTVTTGDICIMSWGSKASGQAWRLTVSNSAASVRVFDGYIVGTANIADGQWHHVAVVLDADSSLSNGILYVDGVQDPISETVDVEIDTADSSDVSIGSNYGTGWYFNGMIDEVKIYDKALSIDEILNFWQ